MVFTGVRVAVSTTVALSPPKLTTTARRPFGVIAIEIGRLPTGIDVPDDWPVPLLIVETDSPFQFAVQTSGAALALAAARAVIAKNAATRAAPIAERPESLPVLAIRCAILGRTAAGT
jgi:hypothetical protein